MFAHGIEVGRSKQSPDMVVLISSLYKQESEHEERERIVTKVAICGLFPCCWLFGAIQVVLAVTWLSGAWTVSRIQSAIPPSGRRTLHVAISASWILADITWPYGRNGSLRV